MDRYYLALAFADLCANFTGPLPTWLIINWKVDMRTSSDASCKLVGYILNVASASSAWILVAMTTQRAMLVLWPHRVGLLCTPKRS